MVLKPFRNFFVFLFLVGFVSCGSGEGETSFNSEAINELPADEKIGERPYEMEGRKEARASLVDFEDLSGWKVRGYNGGKATLQRSREQQMWGDYVAKVTYWGETRDGRVEISPPKPIEIPEEFNAVNIWLYGDNWGWIHYPSLTRAMLSIRLLDVEGESHEVNMGVIDARYWFLAHRTLTGRGSWSPNYTSSGDGKIDFPAKFVSFVISPCADSQPRSIYLDSLSFYREALKPLVFQERAEELPFPTTPDTILPSVMHEHANHASETESGYSFQYDGSDSGIEYVYRPVTGTLSDVEVIYDGKLKFRPMSGGGITFEVSGRISTPEDQDCQRELLSKTFDGGVLTTHWLWKHESVQLPYSLSFQIKGKSLIVDATAPGGNATEFVIGKCGGLPNPKLIKVPYLTFGWREPRVLCSSGLFVFGLLDWYHSDASRFFERAQIVSENSASCNGGSQYIPRTDGKRNDLRERLFLTVSPDFQEVLPNIPNPPSPMREIAGHYLWRNIGQIQPELCKKYKAYGIDWFMANHHEVVWRDGGESFTLRLNSAPKNVGDERLKEYSELLRSLGYRFGLYTNYSDYAPVNENWDEDKVSRLPNGDWQRAWPRNYALKPAYAREFEAWYAPRIHEKFGTSAGYCDVHTALIPWDRTDYDARVPGAGMFRPVFESFGELLYRETKFHDGPVFSEGRMHWLYAGLADGNYAQIVSPAPFKEPLLVDFDLLKIHQLETDFGMGMPSMFYEGCPEWSQSGDSHSPYFDRFVAATIAYGHIGYLTDEWGLPGTLKSYFLLQQIQQRYATSEAVEIKYDRDGKLVPTSEALASDAYKIGRVFVRYSGGLKVFVNYNEKESWTIEADGQSHVLPPFGFYASDDKGFLEYSKLVRKNRVEFVNSPEYLYVDTRGEFVRLPEIAARGALSIKRETERLWWLIPATRCEDFCIYTRRLMPRIDVSEVRITAVAESGEDLGRVEPRLARGGLSFTQVPNAVKYKIEFLDEGEDTPSPPFKLTLLSDEWEVGAGERFPVKATVWNFSRSELTDINLRLTLHAEKPLTAEKVVSGPIGQHSGATSEFSFEMPTDATGVDRIWIRGDARGIIDGQERSATAWLDFRPVPAMEINLLPQEAIIARPGEKVTFRVETVSHLRWDFDSVIEVASGSPPDKVLAQQKALLKRGRVTEFPLSVVVPDQEEIVEWTITVSTGSLPYKKKVWLKATNVPEIAHRLSDLAPEPIWGYCVRGGQESTGDSRSGATFIFGEHSCGGVRKVSYFAHPPYMTGVGYTFARFRVDLPPEPLLLTFSIGLRDGSTSQDGVVFKVTASTDAQDQKLLFEKRWDKTEWSEESVDLSDFAGQQTVLKLITDVGPDDNSNSDWACWGDPRIILAGKRMKIESSTESPG
jgi:hypothetical protein